MTTVGFIGPGVMGAPMITNLVQAGHNVRALGRSDASQRRIADTGADRVGSVAELADGAELVITMVPDTPDVRAVLLDQGLADLLQPEQTYIDMSTIAPSTAVEVHQLLAGRGVGSLDAPVSGGERAAFDGTLSIMVGGDDADLERVRPVLSVLGSTITHVGPAGSGQLTKAANQLIVAANIQALSEAVVFLESAGVDLAAALSAIGGGLAGSTVLDRKRDSILADSFDPGFRVELHDKDLGIVGQTVREQGNALPLTGLVTDLMAALKAQGDGDRDHSALLLLARRLNGRS